MKGTFLSGAAALKRMRCMCCWTDGAGEGLSAGRHRAIDKRAARRARSSRTGEWEVLEGAGAGERPGCDVCFFVMSREGFGAAGKDESSQ